MFAAGSARCASRSSPFTSLAWLWLLVAQITRAAWPLRAFVWTGLAEWSGLLLVASISGWLLHWSRSATACHTSPGEDRLFLIAQLILVAVAALLVAWVASDFSFDGVGADFAKLGFIGRGCACPAALMLLGTSIVMAWQSTGSWRALWQFAAMGSGVLFTASIGCVRIDVTDESPWLERRLTLMISTGMMATMTWLGLPRGLPRNSDWICRGRQASPIFVVISLLLMVSVLIEMTSIFPSS